MALCDANVCLSVTAETRFDFVKPTTSLKMSVVDAAPVQNFVGLTSNHEKFFSMTTPAPTMPYCFALARKVEW
jgi:hypothetical protein